MKRARRRQASEITVQEVAARAGVSAMTVSRVVNGSSHVRAENRDKVTRAIEQLGYLPNPAARSLAAGSPTRLGLLYVNPSSFYLSRFLIGALEGARRLGQHLVLEWCDELDPQSIEEALRRFRIAHVRGVVLPPPLSESEVLIGRLAALDMPVVAVASGGGTVDRVSISDFEAAVRMTRHLLDLGHRRIGFIRGHPNQISSSERFRGFAAALDKAGIDVAPMPAEQGYFTYQSGLDAAERLLARDDRPSAIFAANDDMAAAAIGVAHRRGLRVPADLSVVGFDDTGIAVSIWPELTTIRQPIGAMAEAAVPMLLRRLEHPVENSPQVETLAFELIVRQSCGPAAP